VAAQMHRHLCTFFVILALTAHAVYFFHSIALRRPALQPPCLTATSPASTPGAAAVHKVYVVSVFTRPLSSLLAAQLGMSEVPGLVRVDRGFNAAPFNQSPPPPHTPNMTPSQLRYLDF
jgi:hypothetical protein